MLFATRRPPVKIKATLATQLTFVRIPRLHTVNPEYRRPTRSSLPMTFKGGAYLVSATFNLLRVSSVNLWVLNEKRHSIRRRSVVGIRTLGLLMVIQDHHQAC